MDPEDYKKLSDSGRRMVGRYIRALLRAQNQTPRKVKSSDPMEEIAVCRKWAHAMRERSAR